MAKQKKHTPAAESEGPPARASGGFRPRSGLWYRVIAGLGIPLLLILAAEVTLRVAGYGYPTGFFVAGTVEDRPIWRDNQEFGRRFFPSGLVRLPQVFSFPAVKPEKTFRIFVLGESAAMGDPDFKFGLPRMLEVLLRDRFPGHRFEVINAAMVAINSHVILPIAEDAADKQADLWVIYMGNNEVIGPFGSASIFGARAPRMFPVRAGLELKQTRLGQWLDSTVSRVRRGGASLPEWTGMEMMASQRVLPNSTITRRVHQHFERNLADILRTGVRAGVPVLLCTVASNLKDCAPFGSLHRAGLAPDALAAWESLYRDGVALQERGDYREAKASFDRAAGIDAEFADLAFRRAQVALEMGLPKEAADLFAQARDLDALQFRADSRVNGAIRQLAGAFSHQGVALLDSEPLFAANSPSGITGRESFYEHVHLTPEGNYLLARAAAEQAAGMLGLTGQGTGSWLSLTNCLARMGFTGWNRYDALNTIVDRLQMAPFTGQIGHADQMRFLNDQLARALVATKPAQLNRETKQVAELVERYPDEPNLRWNIAQLLQNIGDNQAAAQHWRELMRLQPHSALPVFNLARLLDRPGSEAEASRLYLDCLRLDPEYFPASYALGVLLLKTGQTAVAIAHLKRAVALKPNSTDARLALADGLAALARVREAEAQLLAILERAPGNTAAAARLQALRESR